MKIEIHHLHHPDEETAERLVRIERMLGHIQRSQGFIMATMDDLKAAVTAETTVEGSLLTLLTSIAQQLQAAKNNNDPAATQSVIDQINSNTKAMADAITANTPAAPTPSPPVTPPPETPPST
jgi:hypothetical protein